MNQLQAVAMNEGYRWKKKLFSEKGRGLLEGTRAPSQQHDAGPRASQNEARIVLAFGPAAPEDGLWKCAYYLAKISSLKVPGFALG